MEVGAMNTTWTRQGLLDQFGRVATILHHGLAFLGLVAVLLILVRGKTLFLDENPARSAVVGSIRYDGAVSLLDRADDTDTQKYRALANYVSRKYRIAPDVTEQFVGAAYDAGRRVGLDPLLILAVMAVESRFNPVAESLMGAKGLMQVISRKHLDKLLENGGEKAGLDPKIKIALGARILKEYVRRTGSLEAGPPFLHRGIAGASSQKPPQKLSEKERLQDAVRPFGEDFLRA